MLLLLLKSSAQAGARSYFGWFYGGMGSVPAGGSFRVYLAAIRSRVIGGGDR